MAVEDLDHYTIKVADLDRSVQFYKDIIGLEKGAPPRPGFNGAWLYLGPRPVVHLFVGKEPAGESNGALDHVAFRFSDFEGTCAHLKKMNLDFRRQGEPGARRQIFLHDVDGVKIELNFPVAS